MYQFKDLMILLLIASAVIALILNDRRTAVVLIALVLIDWFYALGATVIFIIVREVEQKVLHQNQ